MKDRNEPQPGPSKKLSERIHRDLQALSERSRQNTPSLDQTIHSLSDRQSGGSWEERMMAWTGFFKTHPKFATATVTTVMAAALLLVPISYNKVVGHEVTVSLDGSKVSEELVEGLASEFKEVLGAEAVHVNVSMDDGQRVYTFSAAAPENNAPAVSRAFARTLTDRGIEAEAASTPIRKEVSGNVYAMAYDNTFGSSIQIDIDGKSAEQIESEILAQLEAAGFDAEVSVSMDDQHMKIEVKAESDSPMGETDDHANIVLTKGGEALAGMFKDVGCKIIKSVDDSGEQLVVEVNEGGQVISATVADPGSLSDTQIAESIHKQLADQGVLLSVSVSEGQVKLMQLAETEDGPTAVKKTTWGRLKSEGVDGN